MKAMLAAVLLGALAAVACAQERVKTAEDVYRDMGVDFGRSPSPDAKYRANMDYHIAKQNREAASQIAMRFETPWYERDGAMLGGAIVVTGAIVSATLYLSRAKKKLKTKGDPRKGTFLPS